jgi:hypothetical protein
MGLIAQVRTIYRNKKPKNDKENKNQKKKETNSEGEKAKSDVA